MSQPDPLVHVVCWKGPASALAARLNVAPAHLLAQINRRGQRRGATAIEISIQSPQALRTLRHALAVADEEP